MGMGLRFEQDGHSDDGICAVGQYRSKYGLGNGNWIPPSGPSLTEAAIKFNTHTDLYIPFDRMKSYVSCFYSTIEGMKYSRK